MEPAQARDRCQPIDRKVAFEVSFYVIQNAGQPASIKSLLWDTQETLRRRWAEMILKVVPREAGSERFDKQLAGGGWGLQLRYDCRCDAENKRVLEAAFVTQRRSNRFIELDAEAVPREVAGRKIDMQNSRHRSGEVSEIFL